MLIDWDDTGSVLRLGQVAHERTPGGVERTSLYCVTWTVQGGAVTSMTGQQVVATGWQHGFADPSAGAAVLREQCTKL